MKILRQPQSGSVASKTSSRNRYGQYYRTRATPVNPNSTAQQASRTRMSANASAWRTLTDGQRAGWLSLGSLLSRTDSLGQVYTLTGFQAYCMVNNNNLAAGNAVVAAAPAFTVPATITTITLTLTAIAFSIAYTPTPLATGERIFTFASPQRSAGRGYEGDFRLIAVSAAAAASPANVLAAYTAKFGVPVVGTRIFVSVVRYSLGFTSLPLGVNQVVA
jgi:hypothetical protein